MFVSKLLVAALAAFPGMTIAAPSNGGSGMALQDRGIDFGGVCRPGMFFLGFKRKCKCKDDGYWYGDDDDDCYDDDQKRCHPKSHPQQRCGRGERQYCAKSENDWCEYDKRRDLCNNDGHSKTFCCKPDDIHKKLKEVCPSRPTCPKGQSWDERRGCVCPKNQVWRDRQCKWKPMDKPKCRGKQVAYCAKDSQHFCKYDDKNDWCGDNGHHITFCCKPENDKPKKKCESKWKNGDGWDSDDEDSDRYD